MRFLATAILAAVSCLAQTQIVDTLYTSDSTPFTGTLRISWPPFVTAAGQAVAAGTRTVSITGGVVNMQLWPTQGAGPATSYTVATIVNGQLLATERWGVPNSGPVTLAAVRNVTYSGTVPVGGAITVSTITNLFNGSNPGYLNKDGTSSAFPASTLEVVPFSATPNFSFGSYNAFKLTLTGNVASFSGRGLSPGNTVTMIICQDATGGWTFPWTGWIDAVAIPSAPTDCLAQSFIVDDVGNPLHINGTAVSGGGGSAGGGVNVVSFSTTPNFNLSLGTMQMITLASNVNNPTISSATPGQVYTFKICQNGSGGNTFNWSSAWIAPMRIGGVANKCSAQLFVADNSTTLRSVAPGILDQ